MGKVTDIRLFRLISIDAFRAVIMVLMIFVNDLWSLTSIPSWLEHVSADTDGLGLADIVFPAFLFIVGLSIPYAIGSRRRKGDKDLKIFYHIILRTIALLIMGLFLVNADNYDYSAILPKQVWMILLIISFFLIWMAYQNPNSAKVWILKSVGIVLLITLAFIYKSNGINGIIAMETHWWGILGLIGWAYFISSSVFLFTGGKLVMQIIAFVFFMFFSSAFFLGWLAPIQSIKNYVWISENGAMPAFSMVGIITAITYNSLRAESKKFWTLNISFAIVLIIFGFITRPIWGINKIKATPSWTSICSGIAIIGFLVTVFITDLKKKISWYQYIKPAGTSTLTCYLIPYIHYAIIGLIGIQLPIFFRTGGVGLLKSFIYALLIVLFTGILEKKNIRLKI